MKYEFTKQGIKAFENNSLEEIFSALAEENQKFKIEDLDIKIKIGDHEIEIPSLADAVSMFFDCLYNIDEEINEMGEIE